MNKIKTLFLLIILLNIQNIACGTIEGLVDNYLNYKTNRDEFYELAILSTCLLHCKVVYDTQYKATKEQHQIIGKMVLECLKDSNKITKLMAIKSYILFDELNKLGTSDLRLEIIKLLKSILEFEDLEYDNVRRRLSFYNFTHPSEYFMYVKAELEDIFGEVIIHKICKSNY